MKIKAKQSKQRKFFVVVLVLAILLVGFNYLVRGKIAETYAYLRYQYEFFQETKGAAGQNSSGVGVLVPVLFYPDIASTQNVSGISAQNLKEQLFALKEAGYETITLGQFNDFIQGKAVLPAKSFLLAFNGNQSGVYDMVDPLLKALDYHAVMFVTTDSIAYANNKEDAFASGRWDVASSTQFLATIPGKRFTQNNIGEGTPEREIDVQPEWTSDDLLKVLSAGSSKNLPLSEDLNVGSSDWFIGWGAVQFSGNGATISDNGSSTSGGVFLDGSQSWTNYAFDASVSWASADTVTLYARYHDASNYVGCEFSQSGVRVIENVNGTSTVLSEGIGSITIPTLDLGIRVIQDRIECVLNSQVVGYAYGANPSLLSGAVGVSAWSKVGNVTSVTVRSVQASTYDTAQEYAQVYHLIRSTTSTVSATPSQSFSSAETTPILTGVPPTPLATPIQNLGSPSVFAHWTAGTNSAMSADTSLYTEGSQSLSLTTDGNGDLADAMVTNQGPYNLTNKYLEVWIRVSAPTNAGDLWFVASSDNLHTDSYTWSLNEQIFTSSDESEIQAGEWVPIVLTFDTNGSDMVTTGIPNIAALNSFELHISDKAAGPLTVWLGGISAVAEPPQAALTIVLDNGWSSEYSLAMPTLAKYGFPAVIAEIPQTANDASFMSTQQLQNLQNNLGWDIACHTWDHAYQLGLPTTTIAIMDSEFTQCKNWLVQNGLGKASNVLVWPDGSNSPAAIAEASKYFVAARGIVGTAFNTLPVANPMLLYATEFGGSISTSTLDADVDRCMANHEWCIFYGHIITTSTPADEDEYGNASFDDFIAHVAQVGIPVKTITDVLANEPNLPAPSEASLQFPPGTSAPLTSPSDLSIPYTEDDFIGDAGWQGTWGTMSVASSGFMDLGANDLTSGASAILANTEHWINYQFNATFNWTKGQEVGLIGRYVDDNNYLECDFETSLTNNGVTLKLEQYINGNQEILETGGALPYGGAGDEDDNGSIRVYGSYATCSFNGYTLPEYNMTIYPPPMAGGIGFDMWDPTLDNSEIIVKNVDVEPAYFYQP